MDEDKEEKKPWQRILNAMNIASDTILLIFDVKSWFSISTNNPIAKILDITLNGWVTGCQIDVLTDNIADSRATGNPAVNANTISNDEKPVALPTPISRDRSKAVSK